MVVTNKFLLGLAKHGGSTRIATTPLSCWNGSFASVSRRAVVGVLSSSLNWRNQTTVTTAIMGRSPSSTVGGRSLSTMGDYDGGGRSGGFGGGAGAGAGAGGSDIRAYPQYTVFGESFMLSVKIMPPTFRLLRSRTLVVDGNKVGRIMLEWIPRSTGKSPSPNSRENRVRFGLSPEEVGLILEQLPEHEVQLVRRPPPQQPGQDGAPEKVLDIVPMEGGQVSFKVDYEKDGVGGQSPNPVPAETAPGVGPMEVVVQLGEFSVMREIMRQSIPKLIGWDPMVNIVIERSIEDGIAFSQRSGSRASGSGRYGNNNNNEHGKFDY